MAARRLEPLPPRHTVQGVPPGEVPVAGRTTPLVGIPSSPTSVFASLPPSVAAPTAPPLTRIQDELARHPAPPPTAGVESGPGPEERSSTAPGVAVSWFAVYGTALVSMAVEVSQ